MRTIKKLATTAMAGIIAALMLATLAAAAVVEVKTKEGIGNYLTDDKGMTLYQFRKDTPGKSACLAAPGCLGRWPVYYVDKVEPKGGPDQGEFGTITRDDGKKQTTFKGLPLYYFFNDKEPGDTKGQGMADVWYVAVP